MGPLFEFLIKDLLVLVLNQVVVSLIILLNYSDGFRLQRCLEKLLQSTFVSFKLFEIDSKVPIDDVKENLF